MSGLTNTVSIYKISTNISFTVFESEMFMMVFVYIHIVPILNFYIDPSTCVICADLAVMVTDGLLLYFPANSLS